MPPKLLILLAFLTALGTSQSPPTDAPPPPQKPAIEREALPPLPYSPKVPHRFIWEYRGVPFASTEVEIGAVSVSDGKSQFRVKATLEYDRDGRILSGTSEATYGKDVGEPLRYRRRLTIRAAGVGGSDSDLTARFDGGIAAVTRREGTPDLKRSDVQVPEPTWLLDDQCFEHWVLLAPYFSKIPVEGALLLFIPYGESTATYTIRHERTEGEGKERRERWTVRQPAVDAKIWTDPQGRLVEYLQGEVRIVFVPAASTSND